MSADELGAQIATRRGHWAPGLALTILTIGLLIAGGVMLGDAHASRPLAIVLLAGAVLCAVAAIRAAAVVYELHEHGVRRVAPWTRARVFKLDEIVSMTVDIVRRGAASGGHHETEFHLTLRARDGRRLRVVFGAGPSDDPISAYLERLAVAVAAVLEAELERAGAIPFGRMARLTRDGIESSSTPRLFGGAVVETLAYGDVRTIERAFGMQRVSRSGSEAHCMVQIAGGDPAVHVRCDGSDENFHPAYIVLTRRLRSAQATCVAPASLAA